MYTKKKDKSKSQEIVYYVVLPLPSRDRPYVRSTENLNFIFVFFVKISDFFRQYLFGHGGAHIQAAEGGRDSVGKNPTPPPLFRLSVGARKSPNGGGGGRRCGGGLWPVYHLRGVGII